MKRLLLLTVIFLFASMASAQVTQKIVVEHFTNTKCGICASKNPALFTNIANNNDVIHIAVHPSSPYSTCVLYQHNKTENNARTNFYGILGSTPRIVINGDVQSPSVNFSSSTLFDNYKAKTSPFSISVWQLNHSGDSLVSTIVIKAVSAHSLGSVSLYVPLVEDSLNYNAPNGEKLHHNVFRKVLLSKTITLPAMGDSLVLTASTLGNVEWNWDNLRTQVFIQKTADKKFIQAEVSGKPKYQISDVNDLEGPSFNFYPNPVVDKLEVVLDKSIETQLSISTLEGKLVLTKSINQLKSNVDVSSLENGLYFISIKNSQGTVVKKFVKDSE